MRRKLVRYLKKKFHKRDLECFLADFRESRERLRCIGGSELPSNLNTIRISVKDYTFSQHIKIQSEGRRGIVNDSAFVTNIYPDLNVVINNANKYVPLVSRSGENWLFHIEPPGYIKLLDYGNEENLKRYSRVYTSNPDLYNKGGKYIASPPYVHWHLEVNGYTGEFEIRHDYDFLRQYAEPPEKTNNLVALNSNVNSLPGHKLRADFIRSLCEAGIDFELYGGSSWAGYPQYVDNAPLGKWPSFSKSRYALVIENEVAPYYWSEKITDALLCWAMPIYHGCPNLEEYLPEGSFVRLDITRKGAMDELQEIIASDYYEKNISKIAEARELILGKYNILNFIDAEFSTFLKSR